MNYVEIELIDYEDENRTQVLKFENVKEVVAGSFWFVMVTRDNEKIGYKSGSIYNYYTSPDIEVEFERM